MDIGREHVCYCPEHKLAWHIGSNLFSSWHDQTVEERNTNLMLLQAHYTQIDASEAVYAFEEPTQCAEVVLDMEVWGELFDTP